MEKAVHIRYNCSRKQYGTNAPGPAAAPPVRNKEPHRKGEYPMDYNKAALEMHAAHHGKLEVIRKVPVKTRDDLSTA